MRNLAVEILRYYYSILSKIMEKNMKNYCVILAGGKGRRLWPSSRERFPKQFIDFFGTGRTQLQTTFDRFVKILPPENIFVCTNQEFAYIVREQLPDLPVRQILVEPVNRGTAPSVAWADMRILRRNPDANIIIVPSDQFVLNEDSFLHSLDEGISYVAEHDVMLVMGVKPTRPEPGYGYIQLGDLSCKPDVYQVKSFTEKPEREFATMFMESGEFYWNTGIFLAKGQFLIENFERMFPEVLRNLKVEKPDYSYEEEMEYVTRNYPRYPNMKLDTAVLEHGQNIYVMKCDFGWADLGTWHAIYECMERGDGDNVVVNSEVMLEESSNNIIKLPKGHVGVINGLDGYIIAEEGDVLLICKKSDSSALIRKYVAEVSLRYGEKYI